MALFEGRSIAAAGVALSIDSHADAAISARIASQGEVTGEYDARKAESVEMTSTGCVSECAVYLDGARVQSVSVGKPMTVPFAAGHHSWQITRHLPTPPRPVVDRTENLPGGAEIRFTEVAGAQSYRVETSRDGGLQWSAAMTVKGSPAVLKDLPLGSKVHVRVIAVNPDAESLPGDEYPIYVTDQHPATPDGLNLVLTKDRVSASWGQILGSSAYALYRRRSGSQNWTRVYSGLNTFFEDAAKGVEPPAKLPGREDNPEFDPESVVTYEYAVAAVNGNGESAKSPIVNTDPTNWLNWWPQGVPRRFKRQTAFWQPPYVPSEMSPPMYYPDDAPPTQ
jgi:hypothetical protein